MRARSLLVSLACLAGCGNTSGEGAGKPAQEDRPAPVDTSKPASPAPAGKPLPACEVLTAAEVGALAGAAVEIKPDETGPDQRGHDHCAWVRTGGESAELVVSLFALREDDTQFFDFTKALTIASIDEKQHALSGLGDAAYYRAFDNGAGGTLMVRSGRWVLTLSGRPSRDAQLRGARTALAKLGG